MSTSIDQLDDLLPQTQCGLCTYAGCKPYAEAIIDRNERFDLCTPGGVDTLLALSEALHQDATPFVEEMRQKQKQTSVVVIRESECIGCTKCIQACPVDAILGAAKKMHSVIESECTGCDLCIPACPVDCIDIILLPEPNTEKRKENAQQARQHFLMRNARLERNATEKAAQHAAARLETPGAHSDDVIAARKAAVSASIARSKLKQQSKKQRNRCDPKKN